MKLRWPWCLCDSEDFDRLQRAVKRIEAKLDAALATTAQAAVLTEALRAHTDALRRSLSTQPPDTKETPS